MNADIYGVPKCYKMRLFGEILQYDPEMFRSLASNFLVV